MQIRHGVISLLMLALMAGFSFTIGIVAVGPDSYKVSEMRAPARGGGAEAERVVLAETDALCRACWQPGRVPSDVQYG